MDSRSFLGLQQSHNPYRWSMEVAPTLATTGGFLFGGCGLGAAISALEQTSGRECVWAAGQYLSYAKPGEVMDIDVTIAGNGSACPTCRRPTSADCDRTVTRPTARSTIASSSGW